MIVDRTTLNVLPVADQLLHAAAREIGPAPEGVGDVEFGPVTWSNELVAHVVEFKSTAPIPLSDIGTAFSAMQSEFEASVRLANRLLAPLGACLLSTGMHPWMDPARETRLWPHEYREVYKTFDRLFHCSSHGWANLQSMHLNLPFSGDEEFGRLHAAVRIALPLLPALAASTPVVQGRLTGTADSRLEFYRTNSSRVPSLTGRVIPEQAFSQTEYEEQILEPIRRDLERLDVLEHLKPEFANARGAIARFDRGSIEIRLLDVQETPAADLSVAAAVIALLRNLCAERWSPLEAQKGWSVDRLLPILESTIRSGDQAVIRDSEYLALFGIDSAACAAGELWRAASGVFQQQRRDTAHYQWPPFARACLAGGTLSRRISALLENVEQPQLLQVYRTVSECLEQGSALGATTPVEAGEPPPA